MGIHWGKFFLKAGKIFGIAILIQFILACIPVVNVAIAIINFPALICANFCIDHSNQDPMQWIYTGIPFAVLMWLVISLIASFVIIKKHSNQNHQTSG
ncbi:hypothetical protein JD969_09600 [Planctomycetota bacterium]|nr:hypothetical protein JD969_09600 [Planctomycetota bacterium]